MTAEPVTDAEKEAALREASLPPPRTGTTVKDTFPPPPGPRAPRRRPPESRCASAPGARGRGGAGPEPERHVLAADGGPDVPRGAGARGRARLADARAARAVALGGDEDAALRARRSASRWPRPTRRRSPRACARPRAACWRAAGALDVLDAAAALVASYPEGRARAPRHAAARGLRPEGGSAGGRSRPVARARGSAPRLRARLATAEEVAGRRGREPLAARRRGRGPMGGLPRRGAAARRRRGHGDGGPGHALGRGAATHRQGAGAGASAPTARCASPSHRCGWRKGECPPFTPWQIELLEPDRRQGLPQGDGARGAGAARAQGGRPRRAHGGQRARHGPHRVPRHAGGGAAPTRSGRRWGRTQTRHVPGHGRAADASAAPGGGFVVLDPAAGPRFSVFSVNHDALKVRAYAVAPGDWPGVPEVHAGARGATRPRRTAGAAGPRRRRCRCRARPDELTETRIDLSPALHDGLGQLVLVVEPGDAAERSAGTRQQVMRWVQATRIGLDAFAGDAALTAWATSLADGRPLPGVEVELLPAGRQRRDRRRRPGRAAPCDSAARRPRGAARAATSPSCPRARTGGTADRTGSAASARDQLRFYVFDDRKMYRPGRGGADQGLGPAGGRRRGGRREPSAGRPAP